MKHHQHIPFTHSACQVADPRLERMVYIDYPHSAHPDVITDLDVVVLVFDSARNTIQQLREGKVGATASMRCSSMLWLQLKALSSIC